jgi:hypothetical protein
VPEQSLPSIRHRAWLGVNKIVAGTDKEAEVRCRVLKLQRLPADAKLLCKVHQSVGNTPGGALFEIFHAAALEPLTALHGVPLKGSETVNRQAQRRGIGRIHGNAESVVPQGRG